MGNQPSAPSPPSPPQPPPPPPPPLPPPCDLDCQKQKQLVILKQALDDATDPEAQEKARIAYYTLLNGQGWLAGEKNRIATEEIEPVLASYSTRYNALKGEQQSYTSVKRITDALGANAKADEGTNAFLNKEMNDSKDRADVLDRLNKLNSGEQSSGGSYIPLIMDFILTLLGIYVLYMVVAKLSSSSVVPTATNTGVL
jgi:hypothetical protein